MAKKKPIFISFSSKDIGDKGYVHAVESAIHSIGYEADHMNRGVLDTTVIQPELDERIRRSRLVIMVLDQQYKDCKRLRHEFEEVTQEGNRIKTLIFIKDYNTPNERRKQDENIFNVLKINENRYVRFENHEDLRKNVEIQLNRWYKDERHRIERSRRMRQICIYVPLVLALVFCFWWAMHYIKPPVKSGPLVDTPEVVTGNDNGTSNGDDKELIDDTTIEKPLSPKPNPVKVQPKREETTNEVTKKKTGDEIMVIVPNTFAVDCDDKLLSADICDAVSQVLPSFSQPGDASKAQWTISVEQSSIHEVLKEIDSDALKVDVNYIIEITNNAENKIITKKIENVRGRSINQNREDAIRNANDNASKEIIEIIKQCIK